MSITSREIRLKSRPVGLPAADNFELASIDLPAPGAGAVQVKNLWMTVDPYMRGRMMDRESYVPPFQLGEAMQGGAVGEVVASNAEGLRPGDLVVREDKGAVAETALAVTVAIALAAGIVTDGANPLAFVVAHLQDGGTHDAV